MTFVSSCVLKAAPIGQHVRFKMVWSHYFPDYAERMAWMNMPFMVEFAIRSAESLTLTPE